MPGRALIGSKIVRVVSGLLFIFYIGVVPAIAGGNGGKDGDGLPQRWERRHGTNPRVHDAGVDLDHDRLTNRGEYKWHTDPLDADSDDDGFMDGDEVKDLNTDPNEADADDEEETCEDDDGAEDEDEAGDVDDDDEGEEDDDEGEEDDDEDEDQPGDVDENDDDEGTDDDDEECDDDDGEEDDDEDEDESVVATIESFNSSTGRLTLKTTDGKTVTGIVTEDTELEWESADESENDEDEEASTDDLDPGQKVVDYEFESNSENFEEVGLAK